MKKILCMILLMALTIAGAGALAQDAAHPVDEIVRIESFDGVAFDGRLRLPDDRDVDRLVIYVNGSGPNTYDNFRDLGTMTFNYHDLFASELGKRGAGYFSYNTRGVTPTDEAPYIAIDDALYGTYLPSNSVKDVLAIIDALKQRDALKNADVTLLGWSEGAIVAAQVALTEDAPVDRLVLAGYPNDSMADILTWQQTGGSNMVIYGQYFDGDGDGVISAAEYAADPYGVGAALGGVAFDELDITGDGLLTADDFSLLLTDNRALVFDAFENGHDDWLRDNYPVRLTSAWYVDHASIPANSQALPQLDLPIYIFQGTYDANTPVAGAEAIDRAFKALGKDNLTVSIYPADHDLNYGLYLANGEVPEPIRDLLDAAAS